jgi:hypothetical protein
MTSAADDEKKLYTNTKTREDLDYVCDLCGARFYNQNKSCISIDLQSTKLL